MASDDVFRQNAIARIEALRETVLAGDGFALLGAVRICANFDLVMPEWLAREFIQRYDRVLTCEADSWDDAFGRPYPKGTHLNALRKQRRLKHAVWGEVQSILMREPATAIDAHLFERVGARLNIGKTLAASYYYAAVRLSGPAKRPL